MNNQFKKTFEQSIGTELSIWKEMSTINLNKIIENFVKKTNYMNQFEEKYQHLTWSKNYQRSILNKNINIHFQQTYLELILKKKQMITIIFDRFTNTQFEQKYQQSCLNRNNNN